jgi:plastocyanin
MKFSLALAAVFLPMMVNAQYGDSPSSTSSSAAATPSATSASNNNINVVVAPGGSLTYNPSNFTAANGTTVTFVFPQGVPHSVTQSSFANPCTYLAAANGSPGGFDSGLQTSKQFTIKITNDQAPIWFYCKAPQHCGIGMVGAINAPSTGNTADNFLAAAKAIGSNEQTVSDNGPVTGGVNAVATSTPTASSASSASASSSTASQKSDAGRLVASGVFAFLAAALGITLA